MAVAGDYTAGFESIPEVIFDVLIGEVLAYVGLHLEDPAEDFLCCEAVEGASETLESGGVGEERVAES